MGERKINRIIVHHSVSNWGDGDVIMRWHMDEKPKGNGWNAPGYHVVIRNGYSDYYSWSQKKYSKATDGKLDRIWPESGIANGCKYANSNALHVCMIGNFDIDKPTVEQGNSLARLLAFWCKQYKLDPLKDIYGHGEMQKKIGKEGYSKTCPGKNVDMNALRMRVKARA